MANTTTATCLPLIPSLEMAWRDVDSSFERFCLTAGIGAVEQMLREDAQQLTGTPNSRGGGRVGHRWGTTEPNRLAGFAALPMQCPDACADELVRAVKDLRFVGTLINGTTEGRFLDHPSYDGLLAAAVELDVPIYIHPHLPPEPVRQAYYSDLQPGAGRVLESAAWGWHSETAIHVLRMVLSGTLDRHRRLRLVIGHMGEMLPVMLARIDEVSALDIEHLKRPISRAILDQVWLTTSGIFSEPPFLAALLTFGIDRIMFSVDYPYAPNAKGRDFLDGISLAPADMAKLTHSNADALLKLKVGAG